MLDNRRGRCLVALLVDLEVKLPKGKYRRKSERNTSVPTKIMKVVLRIMLAIVSLVAANAVVIMGLGFLFGYDSRKFAPAIGGAIGAFVAVVIVCWPMLMRPKSK